MEPDQKIVFKYLLSYIFSAFLNLFKNSLRDFNEDILRLVFAFVNYVVFLGSAATSVLLLVFLVDVFNVFDVFNYI